MNILILGAGNMGSALASRFANAGHRVRISARTPGKAESVAAATGAQAYAAGQLLADDEVVVLATGHADAVPALQALGPLDGKVVIDITNTIDFSTYEQPEALTGTSTALELARQLPAGVAVLKAFNVNLADTLITRTNGTTATTVLFAGDDAEGKIALADLLQAAGLRAIDAGPLQRSRQLEAIGFLQMVLASTGKTRYESGFTLLP